MTTPSPSPPARRTWLAGALATGAVALGAGLLWRQRQEAATARAAADAAARAAAAASAAAAARAAASDGLLPAKIDVLDGVPLGPADWQGRPLVLNFWAPWCGPCVKEMPELDRFAKAQAALGAQGARVVGLAIDELPAVRTFLAAHPVGFPISVLGYAGLAWVRRLSNDPAVGLPFSAVFDARGQLTHKKFGATDLDELTKWVTGP